MRVTKRWLTGSVELVAFLSLIFNVSQASENATFECAAGPTQLCNFSIIRQPGGAQKFVIQGRQRNVIPGLAPGLDWYMVTVGRPTPAGIDACRHASFRCKVAIVQHGVNQ